MIGLLHSGSLNVKDNCGIIKPKIVVGVHLCTPITQLVEKVQQKLGFFRKYGIIEKSGKC